MAHPSAPPLCEELIHLQTFPHNTSATSTDAAAEMKQNNDYTSGTSINPYATSPVPFSGSLCPSTTMDQQQYPPPYIFPSPPPPPPPMSCGNLNQKNNHNYHHHHQQQEPLLDGSGYAVPTFPMANDGPVKKCCLALCCCCQLKNMGMFCIAFVEFIISALLLAAGLWCRLKTPNFCPFYSALWTSILCIATCLVGMFAAAMDTTHLHVANLVLSLVSVVVTIGGAMVSERNWQLIGRYKDIAHPIYKSDSFVCLFGHYDYHRLTLAAKKDDTFFTECLFQVKLGISINTVQFVFTIFLAVFFTLTAIFCLKKLISGARKR